MKLKFKELRQYISVIDRISICMRETLQYDNYRFMRDVPDKYDDYYVYGIGMIESEFKIDETALPSDLKKDIGNGYYYGHCLEIVLCEVPRNEYCDKPNLSSVLYMDSRFNEQ